MARKIPPLNPLRSFEAAARHGSFARAAAELSVTPAAVSQQVKLLEAYFGFEFFEREPGGVHLSPEARAYAAGLTDAFKRIAALTDEFRTSQTSAILTVRGYTTFLVKWLVPRLPDFQRGHPQIKVRLVSGGAGEPLRAGEADIVIRYGRGQWPGYRAVLLFRDELVPVCSPALLRKAAGRARALSPQRLAALPLLALEARREDWRQWLEQAGGVETRPDMQHFEDLTVVLEFARRGLGVALVQRRYVEEELASGALVLAAKQDLRRDLGYFALARAEDARRSKVAAFLEWLGSDQGKES